jgi:3'(2'), 5'-bisphosphate nucleotidase
MTSNRYDAELRFVLDLLGRCAEQALRWQAAGPRILAVRHKPLGGGPITAADRDLNDTIVVALRERWPDDGVLAEESPDDAHWRVADRCWYVDPIDGTREFARGTAGWTVQIGLCVEGRPVLGVVSEPGARRTCFAAFDGTWRGGRVDNDGSSTALRGGAREFAEIRLIGGKLFPFSRQHAIRRALGVDRSRALSVGSVGVRMTAVARGEADAYVQAPGRTKLWDTCAPSCLVQAAGGRVTDLRGEPLSYRSHSITHPRGVNATGGRHHDEIVQRLRPLTDAWLRS